MSKKRRREKQAVLEQEASRDVRLDPSHDAQSRRLDNPAGETALSAHMEEAMEPVRDTPDLAQQIDGDLTAQPKAMLSGGFDPKSERLEPALRHGATGDEEGIDVEASSMTVVADVDAPLDEQLGARAALPVELKEVPQTVSERGATPLPEEPEPTPDDTRGHRPRGTPEMGHDQHTLRR